MSTAARRSRRVIRSVRLAGWSIQTAAPAFSRAARRREYGAYMWTIRAYNRPQTMEVVNSVIQRMPGTMAGFVRMRTLIVCPQRTAQCRILTLAARVDPDKPAVHGLQQP